MSPVGQSSSSSPFEKPRTIPGKVSLSLFLLYRFLVERRISRGGKGRLFDLSSSPLLVSPILRPPPPPPSTRLYARSTTVNYVFAGERATVMAARLQQLEEVGGSRCARAPAPLIAPSHHQPGMRQLLSYPTNALSSSPFHFFFFFCAAPYLHRSVPFLFPLFTEEDGNVIG